VKPYANPAPVAEPEHVIYSDRTDDPHQRPRLGIDLDDPIAAGHRARFGLDGQVGAAVLDRHDVAARDPLDAAARGVVEQRRCR
jgi:hypothetical protein